MPFGINFQFNSGQYNLSKKNSRLLRIYLLDNAVIDWPLTNRATGLDCIHHIESKLAFDESRYFGLKYLPKTSKSNPAYKPSPRWVNLNKPLKAQLSNLEDLSVYLRIMFYVANIGVFTNDLTRFHYYLQIRNDVIDGFINVGNDEATTLASLAIQAELGDYNHDDHSVDFFREFYLFPESLTQDQDQTRQEENLGGLIVKTIEKYASLSGLDTHEAEHKYVEYCLQLQGYGEEVLQARNEDDEPCVIGSSCYGIIVQNRTSFNNEKTSYRWNNVMTIAPQRSQLNFKIVIDNQTQSLAFAMEDADFAKYAAKMLCCRKMFYDRNQEATNRNYERSHSDSANQQQAPMKRRPTLRKGQEVFVLGEGGQVVAAGRDSPRNDKIGGANGGNGFPGSSQSLESSHAENYHRLTSDYKQHNQPTMQLRQTASFRHRQRPHSIIGPRPYTIQRDITISSPNLNQNISQSELYLNHNHRSNVQQHTNQQYISNPDFYNKIVGFNGPATQGLPTYEEHLMINGSKTSLHHLNGSNQRINRLYHNQQQQQAGIMSRSKQSLNEQFYPAPPPPQQQQQQQPRSSLTVDDYQPDYNALIMQKHQEIPSYDYFEGSHQQPGRFHMSRSYGDIAQTHEKQVSCASQQTMVVLPDSSLQSDHQKVVKDLIDSGLKTLPRNNHRNQGGSNSDMICTENIFEGIGNVREITDNVKDHQSKDEVKPDEKTRAKQIQDNIDNGHYQYQFDEYHDDEEEEDEEVMTIEDDFRITAADYNHEFHNMQMPESDDEINEFWLNLTRLDQSKVVIIHVDPDPDSASDCDYITRHQHHNMPNFTISQTKEQRENSHIFRHFKVTYTGNKEHKKKMRVYFIKLNNWLEPNGEPHDGSLDAFRQIEDYLESLLIKRKYAHPLMLVSRDKFTFAGVFILSRIMLHTTRHKGYELDGIDLLYNLRQFNPRFVTSTAQYLFAHRLIIDFLAHLRLI